MDFPADDVPVVGFLDVKEENVEYVGWLVAPDGYGGILAGVENKGYPADDFTVDG